MEYIVTLAQLLAAFAALWGVNTLMSIRNNLSRGFSWDWKYFWNGVFKAATLAIAMGAGGAVLIYLPVIFGNAGVQISDDMKAAISILGVFGAVSAGLFTQAKKFIENVNKTFNTDGLKLTVKADEKDFNKGVVIIDTPDLPEAKPNGETKDGVE